MVADHRKWKAQKVTLEKWGGQGLEWELLYLFLHGVT